MGLRGPAPGWRRRIPNARPRRRGSALARSNRRMDSERSRRWRTRRRRRRASCFRAARARRRAFGLATTSPATLPRLRSPREASSPRRFARRERDDPRFETIRDDGCFGRSRFPNLRHRRRASAGGDDDDDSTGASFSNALAEAELRRRRRRRSRVVVGAALDRAAPADGGGTRFSLGGRRCAAPRRASRCPARDASLRRARRWRGSAARTFELAGASTATPRRRDARRCKTARVADSKRFGVRRGDERRRRRIDARNGRGVRDAVGSLGRGTTGRREVSSPGGRFGAFTRSPSSRPSTSPPRAFA